jgi:hypothetical protein
MWTRTYGGGGDDRGLAVEATAADSGCVIAGYTTSFSPGLESACLVRTRSDGTVQWTKTYGGTDWDEGRSVRRTLDGGYVIAGSTASFGAGADDAYLVKTDSAGVVQWSKTFGGTGADYGFDVRQTVPDSGFIVVGQTYSYGTSGDAYVVKTGPGGDTLWTCTLGGASIDCAYGVTQTLPDTAYLVVGSTRSFGEGGYDVYLVKLDRNGTVLWTRLYGGAYNDEGHSVAQTVPDSGFVVAGSTRSSGAGNYDMYVLRSEPVLAGVGEAAGRSPLEIAAAPNPFMDTAVIRYRLAQASHVRMTVYDVCGREIARPLDRAEKPGAHSVAWRPASGSDRAVSSGVYLVRLEACGRVLTTKLVLLK